MPLNQEGFEELLRHNHPEWREALQERLVDEKAILRVQKKRADVRDAVRRQILQLAQQLGVEWFIRGDVSEGMRAFQRIQVAPAEQV